MPPRLSARTMLWTGLALAVVSEVLRSIALPRTMFVVPLPQSFLEVVFVVLQVTFYGGVVLAAGSFVVRALQPDDGPHHKGSTSTPWEDRDNRLP